MSKDLRNEGLWDEIKAKRDFMKCPDFAKFMLESDQQKELPQPPLSLEKKNEVIELTADFDNVICNSAYLDLLDIRRSERVYDKNATMTQNQLAFLLWSSQGVQEIRGNGYATLRPVASGGARHSFETYFIVRDVEGLKPGLYHYLPLEHVGEKRVSIEFLKEIDEPGNYISDMLSGQKFAAHAQVVIFLSCVAYRAEWRYSHMAHRVALMDLGHIGQNWMLSSAAMGLGSCCFAAFNQKHCDEVLDLDGFEEYTVYACSVGKAKK
jgi:SagB-type dehydrogenase family enzyme